MTDIEKINQIADLVKYNYFTINRVLADLQYALAGLTGAGELDPDVNRDLQAYVVEVYQQLTRVLLKVVDTIVDDGRGEDVFSDDREVIIKTFHKDIDRAWPHNEFVWKDGSVAEFPQGVELTINTPPTYAEETR
jgi:hypothetical protein